MLDFLSFRNAELLSLLEPKTIDGLDREFAHQRPQEGNLHPCPQDERLQSKASGLSGSKSLQ